MELGYGTAFTRLIINGYLKNSSCGMSLERIRATVREKNIATLKILERLGFNKEENPFYTVKLDPFSDNKKIGKQIMMVIAR